MTKSKQCRTLRPTTANLPSLGQKSRQMKDRCYSLWTTIVPCCSTEGLHTRSTLRNCQTELMLLNSLLPVSRTLLQIFVCLLVSATVLQKSQERLFFSSFFLFFKLSFRRKHLLQAILVYIYPATSLPFPWLALRPSTSRPNVTIPLSVFLSYFLKTKKNQKKKPPTL